MDPAEYGFKCKAPPMPPLPTAREIKTSIYLNGIQEAINRARHARCNEQLNDAIRSMEYFLELIRKMAELGK